MINFTILKKSRKSRARLGVLQTPHGEVLTPALVPVATNATIKGLRSDEVLATGSQLLISNTYHLHILQSDKNIKASGGINKFMNWPRPTMTDSGGFQVFSLGFGRDFGVGKFAHYEGLRKGLRQTLKKSEKTLPPPSAHRRADWSSKLERAIVKGSQPNTVKITEDGASFRSPITGEELFLGPRESIAIQEKIGADIIFSFDECTPPNLTYEYAKAALARTHRWEKQCIEAKKSDQALYGIVQGSQFKDLREQSAKYINKLGVAGGFAGYGIGGDLGESRDPARTGTQTILNWTLPLLDERKPRHLLGIGYIEDIEVIVKAGVDTFDCTVPTHYARRGIAFVSKSAGVADNGRLDLNKSTFLKDKKPLDPDCDCLVCAVYRRNYIAHLVRANEITAAALLTFHNLYFFNAYVAKVRQKIQQGLL